MPYSNPVEGLRSCINDLHQLQLVMPDAQHVQLIHQAMAPLLKIQAELTQAQTPDPRAQALQTLGAQ